jgi:peptidoglycan hydrolase CwlO-like protein
MQKELNPDLFSDRSKNRPQEGSLAVPHYGSNDHSIVNIENKVNELRDQVIGVQSQIQGFIGQINEFAKVTQMKIDRLNQSVAKIEQSHNNLIADSGQKLSLLSNKIGERRSLDLKVQEMMDRHSNILRSFEVRMNQMQKVLSDKESQLVTAMAALNEAKMEIARLKRM